MLHWKANVVWAQVLKKCLTFSIFRGLQLNVTFITLIIAGKFLLNEGYFKERRNTCRTSISNKPNEVKSTTPTPSVHALYSTSVLLNQLGLPKPFSPGWPKPKQQHTVRIFHYHLTMLRTNKQNRKMVRLDDPLSAIVWNLSCRSDNDKFISCVVIFRNVCARKNALNILEKCARERPQYSRASAFLLPHPYPFQSLHYKLHKLIRRGRFPRRTCTLS